jgi:hypothetical protein
MTAMPRIRCRPSRSWAASAGEENREPSRTGFANPVVLLPLVATRRVATFPRRAAP